MAANPPYATASLYVGDIDPNVTETDLFDVFKDVGNVSSIRVCRDAATRRSLGYAYVNYVNSEDAERALDTLNYRAIGGSSRPCRIMWSHRDPKLRRSGKGNIFIKNLDKSIDHKMLCDTFSAFGNILSCKVATDRITGESKGFGFVHYEQDDAAAAAIEQVNGMLLNGKKVYVGEFKPRKARQNKNGPAVFTNVFVKELPRDMEDEKIFAAFAEFGEITSSIVKKNDAGESKGFGFVNFSTPEAARKAVEELNGKELGGKTLFVARAQKKSDRQQQLRQQFEERKQRYQESNCYVKNLDESINDESLRKAFEVCGEVITSKVMVDKEGVSKGFGFVCFSTPEQAHKAIDQMNGQMLVNKPLYVALAQRKDIRAAQLQAQYAHRGAGAGVPGGLVGGVAGVPPGVGVVPGAAGMYGGPSMMMGGPPRGPFVGAPYMARGPAGMGPGANRAWQQQQQQQGLAPPAGYRGPNARGAAGPGAAGRPPYIQQQPPQPKLEGQVPLAQPSLADLSEPERKQMLGEFLYPKIEELLKKEVAGDVGETGKITGMLLESLDHGELVNLLESPSELKNRVEEAINVLREHQQAV